MREVYQFVILALTFIILCIAILYNGHESKSDNEDISAPMSRGSSTGYYTIVIDSCEYIEGFSRLAHKGNCKFCAERRKTELGHHEDSEQSNRISNYKNIEALW